MIKGSEHGEEQPGHVAPAANSVTIGRVSVRRARHLCESGGEHDWNFLLGEWGLLARDTQIAHDLRFLGMVIGAAAIWIGWRALGQGPVSAVESQESSA